MRSIRILSLVIFLYPQLGFSQFSDTFDDNNFNSNPVWAGDDSKFVIDNFQLRLQAPAVSSTAFLSTPSEAINNAVWEFTIKLEFDPSASNFARIYLVSDQADLSGSLNGYFVIVGDTPDEISLYRQSGISTTKIIDGTDESVGLSEVNAAIKVTRDNLGNWQLFSDVGLTGTFISEGTVQDITYNASMYFGVFCNYTSTRSDKFYFDDFLVTGDPYIDIDPPILQMIEVVSGDRLLTHFDEELESASANNSTNYVVVNNIGTATSATLQSDQKSVELIFNNPFQNGVNQLLQVSGVKDLSGNTIVTTSGSFLYFNPVPAKNKDVIIAEIFADPSPQIGLPDAEFIELYNRSSDPFNLKDWAFTDGSSKAILPEKIILPNEYWVITSTSNVTKFGLTTNLIGVANFPTLNNTTDTLVLKTFDGFTIDSLNYNLSWYRNVDKQEGGWSLELIDPENQCAEEENWTSSENENGGTPGLFNSVFANKPDLTGPQLVSTMVLTQNKLLLTFNEKLEDPISNTVSFSITPNIDIAQYYFELKSHRTIILELISDLVPKQLYTLSINNLFDCSGNPISEDADQIDFALPEEGEHGDIIINEILFNPHPNGVDFVELYNKSDKYINLRGWRIANITNEEIENTKDVSTVDRIIAPHEYLVLTSDPLILKNNYPQGNENTFIQISLPSFPDDEGSVAIVSESNVIIDQFVYSKEFHSEFIKDDEGVSLERISFSQNSQEKENWTSANSTVGFATPGLLNSNFRPENAVADGKINIDPTVFAPYSGGTDFSQINFQFAQSGFIANVKIFDQQGRLIKTIANNATLGFEGFFRWDGDQEDGSKARAGYYIVWFEVFGPLGNVKTFRERVIIATR